MRINKHDNRGGGHQGAASVTIPVTALANAWPGTEGGEEENWLTRPLIRLEYYRLGTLSREQNPSSLSLVEPAFFVIAYCTP